MSWALSILGLLVVLAVVSRLQAKRAESRYPARGRFTQQGVHYEIHGDGTPLVLIHGSDGCLQDFDPLIGDLTSDYRVIVYDRPGHGYSKTKEKWPWNVSAQAKSLLGLLNELGIEKATIVGHSWGAAVALAFALKYPKRTTGVLTIAGWVFAEKPSTPLIHIPLIPLIGPLLSATLLLPIKYLLVQNNLRVAFHPKKVDKDYRRLAYALWQRYTWQIVHFSRENSTANQELRRLTKLYNRIDAPVEILYGGLDRAVDSQKHSWGLNQHLQAFNIHEVEKAGHEMHRFYQHSVHSALKRLSKWRVEKDIRLQDALMAHGSCLDCWQSTNRSMEIQYESEAILAGVTCNRFWVSAGEPIGNNPVEAAKRKEGVCWFGVSKQFRDELCGDGSHTSILIGSQPIWNPQNWQQKTASHASLRTQINRAEKKGVTITVTSSTLGLEDCQRDWLGRLAITPLKFLTEPVDFENADGREFFVATQKGRVVGYLVACPIPAANGRFVEELARRPDAPNGTTEALIAFAMDTFAKESVEMVSLGLAPLSALGAIEDQPIKGSVGLAMKWMKAYGNRFYNFEGIEKFKAKMQPDYWAPSYAVVRGEWKLKHLSAIVEAFTAEKPIKAILRFTWIAICQELRWIAEKRKR